MHVLVLADRDWTHPQGGGTGANLHEQVVRWIDAGHRVTVVACGYEGAPRREEHGNLTIERIGGRSTVFPRTIWRGVRGRLPEADVVLEVINGITFLTPLWLRRPRVALVHHIHRDHYRAEMGPRVGAAAAFALETAPLSTIYKGVPFIAVSDSAADDVAAHGVPRERIGVVHNGVDSVSIEPCPPGGRFSEPTLLYLGRLKRYKRIEWVLDAVERIPGARLEIAGDGDHREDIEREIASRGLGDRVTMHGHVSEERKVELLRRSWANVTASSNEGWCLTVMEAAAAGTPTVAAAAGGLRESVLDGETGLLADDRDGMTEAVRRLLHDHELRERLGHSARERSLQFTWDRTAAGSLDALEAERKAAEGRPAGLKALAESDTGRAAGLASAVIAANVLALLFTIVFARVLGASGYGSLAALISAYIILTVPGSALQVAVAREVSRGGPKAGAGVRGWVGQLLFGAVIAGVAAIPFREPLGAALNVDEVWAAAALPACALLWGVLSVERGALQGFQQYRVVGLSIIGENGSRLVIGSILVALGFGVYGAFFSTPLALLATSGALAPLLRKCLPEQSERRPISDLLAGAWIPVVGLTLLFVLQEIHVIVVKHEASSELAGSYGVAAVAAKAIIWVGVGLGMYLLPEAARRSENGLDARPVLMRTIPLIVAVAIPMLLVYTVAGEPLLSAVFGPDLTGAAGALPWLGLAMTLLACAYLSVQYLLALGRRSFVWVLGVAAAMEVGLLTAVGADVVAVAVALALLQLGCAAVVLSLSLRTRLRAAA